MGAAGEQAATDTGGWTGFSAAWRRGYEEIFAIRLVRGTVDHQRRSRSRPAALVRWLGLAYGPGVVALVLPRGDAPEIRAALLILLGTINAGMLAAASLAWGYALSRATTIDALLSRSPDRDTVPRIIHRTVGHRWQITLPALFAVLPWTVPWAAGEPAWSGIASFALALNVTWTMFLLGNVSYWLIVPPFLVLRIRAWRTLVMRWNDPARTPGIRTFSEGYAYSALFLALGTFAVTVPGLLGVPLFGPYLPYLYALLLSLSVWVGVVTQATIYAIVRRFRLRLLDTLADRDNWMLAENRAADLSGFARAETTNSLAIYGSIATAPGLPYGTALVVQYVAALIGSVAGLLLQ